MSSHRHPGGTLRLPSRAQAPVPASAPTPAPSKNKKPAAPPAPPRPSPAEIAARKQANLKREQEAQQAALVRRRQQTSEVLLLLRTRWPQLFNMPVPLATGIVRAITAELGEARLPTAHLNRALKRWTNAPGYLAAVAAGEMRRNLDGTEAGVPDEAQRQFAAEILQQHATRQAPAKEQSPPEPPDNGSAHP